jgi:CheY-like chemotaxis protein
MEEPCRIAARSADPHRDQMGPTIVVAEDNRPFRSMLVSTLTLNGYTPVPAEDGHEALLRVKESMTAALLIDVSLPGISGVRVVEVLRAQPEWENLPVIGMSGYDLADDEAELFNYFLQKPIVLSDLLDYLKAVVPVPAHED